MVVLRANKFLFYFFFLFRPLSWITP